MKPEKKKIEYYDYHECAKYLMEKNGHKESDPENPYQDFWTFVITISDLHNGSFFWMNKDWIEHMEFAGVWNQDKLKPILEEFLSEFGEGERRRIHFKAEW